MNYSVLEEIFVKGKNPRDEELCSEEYVSAFDNYNAVYDKLLENLSEEDKKLLIQIDGFVNMIDSAACAEKFIQGFKVGFKFAREVLQN